MKEKCDVYWFRNSCFNLSEYFFPSLLEIYTLFSRIVWIYSFDAIGKALNQMCYGTATHPSTLKASVLNASIRSDLTWMIGFDLYALWNWIDRRTQKKNKYWNYYNNSTVFFTYVTRHYVIEYFSACVCTLHVWNEWKNVSIEEKNGRKKGLKFFLHTDSVDIKVIWSKRIKVETLIQVKIPLILPKTKKRCMHIIQIERTWREWAIALRA